MPLVCLQLFGFLDGFLYLGFLVGEGALLLFLSLDLLLQLLFPLVMPSLQPVKLLPLLLKLLLGNGALLQGLFLRNKEEFSLFFLCLVDYAFGYFFRISYVCFVGFFFARYPFTR